MDFDEFDAPQFVDFSKENFDAAHEGDSWFSSDSSTSDFEVEELDPEDNGGGGGGREEEDILALKWPESSHQDRQVWSKWMTVRSVFHLCF